MCQSYSIDEITIFQRLITRKNSLTSYGKFKNLGEIKMLFILLKKLG